MTVYGLHASHEQIHPSELLKAVIQAEQAGFGATMSSDHFSPWSERQGHSAIVAQTIGTLAAMYPGRFWAALGAGEATNEHITGDRWSRKKQRTARLRECVEVIRALLVGEQVSHDGRSGLTGRGCGPARRRCPRWLQRR